jgi:hypothetical protein
MTTEDKKKEEVVQIEVHNAAGEDNASQRHEIATPPAGDDGAPEPKPAPPPVFEDPRAAIAARFKKQRETQDTPVEAHGDHTDPTQLYGKMGAVPEPEPPAEEVVQEEPKAPEPRKIKIKVRHEERELTEEEVIALAQKAAAGDSYLEDAKKVFETAKVHVSRPHQDAAAPAKADDQTDGDDPPHQADDVAELVKDIQYGDPDQAAEKLRTTMRSVAEDAVKKVTIDDRVREDTARDISAFQDFVKANPDLAGDENASAVIKTNLMKGYREDLRKIGVPEETISKITEEQLPVHHRHYKLQGQPVRQVSALLETAKKTYMDWKGGPPREEPKPSPQPKTQVSVTVDRDERRRAIPHQPSRAAVPPQMMQPQKQDGQSSRSQAVVNMRKARGQIVAS